MSTTTSTRALPARRGDPTAVRQVDIHAVIEDDPHPRETVIVRDGRHVEAVVNRPGMGPYTEALLSPYPDASPGDWEWVASFSCTQTQLDANPDTYLNPNDVAALITDHLNTRRQLRATVRDVDTVLAVHDYAPDDHRENDLLRRVAGRDGPGISALQAADRYQSAGRENGAGIDHAKFARLLVAMHWAAEGATTGTRLWHTTKAQMHGAITAAAQLGLASTPTEVELAIIDAVRKAGVRPAYHSVGNQPQRRYDAELARAICARMNWPAAS